MGWIWSLLVKGWGAVKEFDTLWDVLEWFGWRKTVLAGIMLILTSLDATASGIKWYHIVGFVLATSFVLLGIAHLITSWLRLTKDKPTDGPKGRRPYTAQDEFEEGVARVATANENSASPFSIQFEDHPARPYFTGGEEYDQRAGRDVFIQRYKFLVASEADVQNVQVEVVRWLSASAYGEDSLLEVSHHALRFEDGSLKMNFARGDKKWVPLIRFEQGFGASTMAIHLEGFPEEIMQRQVEHKLQVRVSAVGVPAFVKCFSVKVDDYTTCIMKNTPC